MTARAPAAAARASYAPRAYGARPLVGRVVARGLSDELNDRHYLIVDATDGRTHYVDIGRPVPSNAEEGKAIEPIPGGSIVRIEPVRAEVRPSDRTIADVAVANGGRYNVDLHLRHDPAATEAFAETHVRRLEAIRRATGGVERHADGTWIIAADHLDRAAAYEAIRAAERPVTVARLSPAPLEQLVGADAATWLDRNLVGGTSEPVRDAGFGAEVRQAEARRRQWLVEQGLAEERDGVPRYRPTMLAELQRREVLRMAGQMSREMGLSFAETRVGDEVTGVYRRSVNLVSGRFAVIERSREFSLVPWRPVLERQLGKPVVGLMRDGGVSWKFSRERAGPSR